MRCSMCGHESPNGSLFCLNCGAQLSARPAAPQGLTPGGGGGLPAGMPAGLPGGLSMCPTCRAENPTGMKFCRNCGTVLAPSMAGMQQTPMMGSPLQPQPAGGFAGGGPGGFAGGGPGGFASAGGYPPPPPPAPGPISGGGNAVLAPTTACPRCGAPTPAGFAFCQQCGFKMQAVGPGGVASGQLGVPAGGHAAPDGHAATLAASGGVAELGLRGGNGGGAPLAIPHANLGMAPTPSISASWGSVVSVNRDGSDGERYPLAAEYVIVGRAGADIVFDDDRFLARQHARLERTSEGVRVVPLDNLNGVFRRIDTPAELVDGSILLLGREVLRYEAVDAEERTPDPLVRHGVALFGSPPREPWGRLLQLLPSGGVRDIRHLWDDEITLGREEGDLVFSDDAFLSRRHASIAWNGKRAQLTDLQSSNGTFVRLTGPLALRHGEYVRMGDQLFRIELRR